MNVYQQYPGRKKLIKSLLALIVLIGFNLSAQAAPKSDGLPFWNQTNESSTTVIDHSRWQQLLDEYLDGENNSGVNLFDYASVSEQHAQLLSSYLKDLQQFDPRQLNRDEQMAYWINLYNALTVEVILKEYPVESITKTGESFFRFGPWDDEVANIQGQDLSLNDIEHRILRPYFSDNRIHYAVNCASIGCPNLATQAFTADNLETLLEQGAHDYVNHPRGVSFKNGELIVSSIYHWYLVDFGDSNETLLEHLIQYAEDPLANRLKAYQGDIDHDYDWQLNKP